MSAEHAETIARAARFRQKKLNPHRSSAVLNVGSRRLGGFPGWEPYGCLIPMIHRTATALRAKQLMQRNVIGTPAGKYQMQHDKSPATPYITGVTCGQQIAAARPDPGDRRTAADAIRQGITPWLSEEDRLSRIGIIDGLEAVGWVQ